MNIAEKNTWTQQVSVQNQILDTLAYFAVFNHPLRVSEVQNFLKDYFEHNVVENALAEMVHNGVCYAFDGYYSLLPCVESQIEKRLEHEKTAAVYLDILPFYARLIAEFPFVRSVAVSGSLSKGQMRPGGDIDYFIITQAGYLWLTRALLVAFKKIFLLNSHKFFCVNYFVANSHLEIPDKNIFTATEIATLLPIYGENAFSEFRNKNRWTYKYIGNFKHHLEAPIYSPKHQPLKKLAELILKILLAHKWDRFFMKLTLARWKKKFGHFDKRKFLLTMRSTRHASKHHPQDFQTTVLEQIDVFKNRALGRSL